MTTAELKNSKSKIENIKFQYATAKTGKTSNSPSGQGYQKAYNTINSVKKKKKDNQHHYTGTWKLGSKGKEMHVNY